MNYKLLKRQAAEDAADAAMSSALEPIRRKAMAIAEVISSGTRWISPKHTSLQFLDGTLDKLENELKAVNGGFKAAALPELVLPQVSDHATKREFLPRPGGTGDQRSKGVVG